MNTNKKYYDICQCCKFVAADRSKWLKHLESEKHKRNGKKKDNYKCNLCSYTCPNNYNFNVHYVLVHASPEERKQKAKFYCEICNFGFFCKLYYDTHIKSIKHVDKVNKIFKGGLIDNNYMEYITELENIINKQYKC